MGFYQQRQLIFESVVPLLRGDTLATLDKLKEVNHTLGLDIPEWEDATVEQLRRVERPKTFWEDPFTRIYRSQVYLKTKNTPFTEARIAPKGDHYFSYRSSKGLVELYTVLKDSELGEEDFNKKNRRMNQHQYSYQSIFYTEEASKGVVSGSAKTMYFSTKEFTNNCKTLHLDLAKY